MRVKMLIAVAAISVSGVLAAGASGASLTPIKVTIQAESGGDFFGFVKRSDKNHCANNRKVTTSARSSTPSPNHPPKRKTRRPAPRGSAFALDRRVTSTTHGDGPLSIFARIAEAKIQDAMERGDFDALPGRGRPLKFEDMSGVPPDMRMGYKILRNAGVAPPEVELRREVYRLDRQIAETRDPNALAELRRRRRDSDLSLAIMLERRAGTAGPRAVRTLRRHRGS
jgi:hypothetical protein